ncbi:phenylacetate--CoA ligase family protein [Ectothiorhodospira haloalkaliphila]|uniref:phenylacetate--CoA ligase family protein n=1 Tax=Ectothiorhodospira haloalkaliphila TaxID=421628 RepID=UPI001EE84758|nr:phenylacetate--CoA ligase family protein [Ectothiorhodospira haloalkaliphila]MCG5524352.1 phenylacetate--CoA ligase family protein [Ectothiorhodospira haloalkaliphila]
MKLKEQLTRHALLPLHEKLRGRDTVREWKRFRANERLSPEAFHELRLTKLRQMLQHCGHHVPYYREVFERIGMTDPGHCDLQDLKHLPILERSTLRDEGQRLITEGWEPRLIRYSTGGSTGEPLVFYTDKHRESCLNAQKLRARSWFGVHPGDRQVDFWGSPIEMSRQSRMRVLKDRWLLNQVVLSASNLTPQRIAEYLEFLARFQPRLIYGYPTVIYRVAQHLLEHPGLLGDYRPRLIACTSEMLLPHLREAIAEAFDCPVANEYGSRDGGMIAHECPEGHLHVFGEHVIVEVDQPDENGVGDLLVTNLDGYGMPFIRYRIGDRGALAGEPCPCGSPLPRLREIQGRANDFLVGREGRLIHSSTANYILREIPILRQYQLRQRPDHSFDLIMVPSRPLTEQEQEHIRAGLCRTLDESVAVRFQPAEMILPEKSGKYRWVMSEAKS